MTAVAALHRGRESYAGRAWEDAYGSLREAERLGALAPGDLELLATAAYMTGREADYLAVLEAAHRAHLAAGAPLRAARCAFWLGVTHARRGKAGPANGWLSRAERLLEGEDGAAVERGYLLLPVVFEHMAAGRREEAAATAGEAAAIGRRCGDPDLMALAAHEQGHILIRAGRVADGLRLLDEAMVAVTAGELSPIVSGLVYCGVILACQDAHDLRRAQEWTAALASWCDGQDDLVAFTGLCLVHRAEILQLRGAWGDALEEARRAAERCLRARNEAAAGDAWYRQAELLRLRGEAAAAEAAYREASRLGREPQPGLALLRLAQGRVDAAVAAIRRATAGTLDAAERARMLPACVEILLAAGEVEEAEGAAAELAALAEARPSAALDATAAHARGAVALARGDARSALVAVRHAARVWQGLAGRYEAARARELLARACLALGDEEGGALELQAARETFEQLGADADLARLASPRGGGAPAHALTARELEVLRLVAAGRSNREVAQALVLSEHTVARHLQNVYAKLGVSSRTAASAVLHERGLA